MQRCGGHGNLSWVSGIRCINEQGVGDAIGINFPLRGFSLALIYHQLTPRSEFNFVFVCQFSVLRSVGQGVTPTNTPPLFWLHHRFLVPFSIYAARLPKHASDGRKSASILVARRRKKHVTLPNRSVGRLFLGKFIGLKPNRFLV